MTDIQKDPLDDVIKNIDAKIEEKFRETSSKIDTMTDSIKNEVRSMNTPTPKSFLENEDDEDAYITKKDVRNIMRDIVTEVKNDAKQIASGIYEEKANRLTNDRKAFEDFPELNNKGKAYNAKYLEAVQSEMNRRVASGVSQDDPQLLYDSAQSIWTSWVRQGRLVPQHLLRQSIDTENQRDDNFDMDGGGSTHRRGPNETQMRLGAQLGLNKEKIAQAIERQRNFQK